MAHKIMIVGYGSTGKYVLDMLTRLPVLGDSDVLLCYFKSPKRRSRKKDQFDLGFCRYFGRIPQG